MQRIRCLVGAHQVGEFHTSHPWGGDPGSLTEVLFFTVSKNLKHRNIVQDVVYERGDDEVLFGVGPSGTQIQSAVSIGFFTVVLEGRVKYLVGPRVNA